MITKIPVRRLLASTRRLCRYLYPIESHRESEAMPQPDVNLYRGFADHCGDSEANARKKAVKTRQRNSKYNIRPGYDEGVSQDRTEYYNSSALFTLAAGDALSQSVHHALEPYVIDIRNRRSQGEPARCDLSPYDEACRGAGKSENEHDSSNAIGSRAIESLGRRFPRRDSRCGCALIRHAAKFVPLIRRFNPCISSLIESIAQNRPPRRG